MKIKILYSIALLLVLTFAFVVYASTGSMSPVVYASNEKCCAKQDCCKDGKCSMNNGGKCNCSDHKCGADCCKDGVCKMGCCKDGKCSMNDGKGENSCPMGLKENAGGAKGCTKCKKNS